MKKIIHINGGIGRCIALTGILQEPTDIICNFVGIFHNHPLVDRVYPPNTPYLYDHIKNADYIEPEPYNMRAYYAENKHLVNCLNMLVNGKDEFALPKIYLTEHEKKTAELLIGNKSVLFQPWGSMVGAGRSLSIPYAQKLVNAIKSKGYRVVMVETQDKPKLENTDFVQGTPRDIITLIPYAKYCIGVDSFLQHAAAALNVPMTVFWGSTLPSQLGYELHDNLIPDEIPEPIPNRIPHNIINPKFVSCPETDENIERILAKL